MQLQNKQTPFTAVYFSRFILIEAGVENRLTTGVKPLKGIK